MFGCCGFGGVEKVNWPLCTIHCNLRLKLEQFSVVWPGAFEWYSHVTLGLCHAGYGGCNGAGGGTGRMRLAAKSCWKIRVCEAGSGGN